MLGYGTYLDLIPELIKDKEVISTGMTEEAHRCKKAAQLARSGKTVSIISGGDPGIYAMAGLVLEMVRSQQSEIKNRSSPRHFCLECLRSQTRRAVYTRLCLHKPVGQTHIMEFDREGLILLLFFTIRKVEEDPIISTRQGTSF